jgi:hypothetical protein
MPIDPVTGKVIVDPAFKRNAQAEAAAIASGAATKAEIEARGGVSAAGYYGDSWSSKTNLTDAEYAEAVKKGGSGVNAATAAKVEASISPEEKKAAADKAAADKKAQDEKDLGPKRDAFAIIKSTLTTYGFTATEIAELNTFIEAGLTNAKMGPEQLKLDMRELPTYKARFAGNTTRVAGGLNALTESQYLEQEDNYSEIFKMYGVGNLSSRAQFASLIGNNISVTETTRRIDAAVKRVKNADPAVLTTLKNLYPSITDTDIVAYFLKPTEMLPELERKTTVAEIGATAKQFGMKENGLARFEDLQTYGVNLAKAREGYATIATELPDITKLGSIYDEMNITYGQTEAEQEQFKGSATAKKNKERLVEREKSSFKGSSGISKVSLSNTPAGQF